MESSNSNTPIINKIRLSVKSIIANIIPIIPAESFPSLADFLAKKASTSDTISFIIYANLSNRRKLTGRNIAIIKSIMIIMKFIFNNKLTPFLLFSNFSFISLFFFFHIFYFLPSIVVFIVLLFFSCVNICVEKQNN